MEKRGKQDQEMLSQIHIVHMSSMADTAKLRLWLLTKVSATKTLYLNK